jgi:hypothetical protein
LTFNQGVVGSSPTGLTITESDVWKFTAAQVVVRLAAAAGKPRRHWSACSTLGAIAISKDFGRASLIGGAL